MIRCGSSKETRVARPSAAVAVVAATGSPVRHASYAAGAASDWTPITSIPGRVAFATTHAPAAPLPPPIGHEDRVDPRLVLEELERAGADAGDEQRLVPGVDVAVAVLRGERLAVLPRLVEVRAVHDQLRAERAHGRHLHGVRALGDADPRGDAEQARGEGDRLAVVPGRGRDHAALGARTRRGARRG